VNRYLGKDESVAITGEAITDKLTEFCYNLSFRDLPPQVVQRTKDALLEFFGLTIRGSQEQSSQAVYAFLRDVGARGRATAIGFPSKLAPQYAALANGTAAHALELDDLHKGSRIHACVVVCPAALAAGEVAHASDQELLTAVVVGYEVATRLGQALNPEELYARGFHPTGIAGVMAATAAAAKVFRLTKEQTVSALGVAGSLAAGSMQFLEHSDETWIKRLHPGWAAHSGIVAAKLAERGFKAPSRIIEGKYGLLRAYSTNTRAEMVLQGLGRGFEIINTGVKLHACCGQEQASIDGVLSIVAKNDLDYDDIESIDIHLVSLAIPIVVEPENLRYNPRTVAEAQYSLPFGVAMAVAKRGGSLDLYTQENVDSPAIRSLMARVRCRHDPDLDSALPEKWPVVVTIETRDGRRFVERVDHARGDAANPASADELVAKFKSLTKNILAPGVQERVIEYLRNMPDGNTLACLMNDLSKVLV
jgi:2-methylcitrate dehydratase PrpD